MARLIPYIPEFRWDRIFRPSEAERQEQEEEEQEEEERVEMKPFYRRI